MGNKIATHIASFFLAKQGIVAPPKPHAAISAVESVKKSLKDAGDQNLSSAKKDELKQKLKVEEEKLEVYCSR